MADSSWLTAAENAERSMCMAFMPSQCGDASGLPSSLSAGGPLGFAGVGAGGGCGVGLGLGWGYGAAWVRTRFLGSGFMCFEAMFEILCHLRCP